MPAWDLAPPSTTQGAIRLPHNPSREAIGVDIRFDGDFVLTSTGDYEEVEAEAYARQWILHCLATNPGEYRPRPLYGVGVPRYLKGKRTQSALDEIKNRCLESLGRNPKFEKLVITVEKFDPAPGRPGLRIFVFAIVAGREHTFAPFDFTEEQ